MKNAVESRGIKVVWHFTRIENLDSILTNGIIPRQNLENASVDFAFNDNYRLDGQKSASCLSISHPNYKMFYSLRMQNPGQEWIVIACSPKILWLKDCAFCYENSASNNVTCIPLQDRKGISAFQSIFEPAFGKPSREEMKLDPSYPTNPQSEVLVFDKIETTYIFGAACQSDNRKESLKMLYPNFQFIYRSFPFSYRLDYSHW